MNFMRIFQISTSAFFVLTIYAMMGGVQSQTCKLNPNNLDKVPVIVYINGGTQLDNTWLSRYCSWRDEGFPYDEYAPVTVKVGAEITCAAKCVCPNESNAQADCQATFQNVCVAVALGDAEYLKFLCCTELRDPKTNQPKGFDTCVAEIPQLKEKIAACMAKTTGADCPQEIALKNAKEVTDKGVIVAENREPFFFFNGIFDKCINDNAGDMWLQTICSMLKETVAKAIPTCKQAMGW